MKFKLPVIRRILLLLTAGCLFLSSLALPAYGLTPFSTPSDVYKESDFYKKLTEIKLSGDMRYDALQVAFSQLGYHAGDSAADFGGDNLSGQNNFAEFSRFYFGSNAEVRGYSWCAMFVSWCLRQARVPTSVCPNEASCTSFVSWLSSRGYYHTSASGYIPKSGDIIFFCDRWEAAGYSTHVGFVVGTENNFVYTIEGNADMSVLQRRYDLNDPYVIGYGTIAYTEKKDTDYSVFPLRYTLSGKGEYEVPAYGLNLYTEPTKSSAVVATFSSGIHFDVAYTSLGWGRVYLREDSSAIGVKRIVNMKYRGYKDDLTEIVTDTAVWFDLTEAQYVERQQNTYLFKYDLQGGTVDNPIPDRQIPIGQSVVISSAIPVKYRNTFIGWGYTKADTRRLIHNGDVYSGPYDRIIYAVWDPDKIEVTYYGEDGKTLLCRMNSNYGEPVTAPFIPADYSKDGVEYEFAGWYPALSQNLTAPQSYRATFTVKSSAETSSATETGTYPYETTGPEEVTSSAIETTQLPPDTQEPTVPAETTVPKAPLPETTAQSDPPEEPQDNTKWIILGILVTFTVILILFGYLFLKKEKMNSK